MRLFAVFLLLSFLIAGGFGYKFIKEYPYLQYSNWVSGKDWNKYYEIPNYRTMLLVPVAPESIPSHQEDYGQLWKTFPIRNSLIPLPTRHPLFKTVPIVEFVRKNTDPQFGMILLNSSDRELSRMYTLPVNLYQDHSHGQDLFKLPFVRNRIIKKNVDTLWNDVFSHQIEIKKKTLDEMIYDLYILHLRSKILPEGTIRYGLIKDGKQALVELGSKDKDYRIEIVMTQTNGSIYSYILRTEKNNFESQKLRVKFLDSITFSPIDPGMGKLLYTEFKQLNFARQVDQEGMLYLFSAWSQESENIELLKSIIFYLERGRHSSDQLKSFYEFSYKQYGKTFTANRNAETNVNVSEEILLQRKIEIEEENKRRKAAESKTSDNQEIEMDAKERMNYYLKKARENSQKTNEDMTVH